MVVILVSPTNLRILLAQVHTHAHTYTQLYYAKGDETTIFLSRRNFDRFLEHYHLMMHYSTRWAAPICIRGIVQITHTNRFNQI